jgi:pimeloyl-ACP methyl ester carboxylesterase
VRIIDRGKGPVVVLVPSLQGRWEYLSRTVSALARSHRVLTFSLCDERAWDGPLPGEGLEPFARQIELVLDDRGVRQAAICGYSFGGRVALRFAATRSNRTTALILVSTPGPGWTLKPAHRAYAQNPLVLAPIFFIGAPARVRAELAATFRSWRDRVRFSLEQLATFARAPLSPSRMARRAQLIDGADVARDCAHVSVPTLVITGEAGLDHVVPAPGTSGYARLIPGSRLTVLPRTGHFGCMTRPDLFAGIVSDFLQSSARQSHERQPVDAA